VIKNRPVVESIVCVVWSFYDREKKIQRWTDRLDAIYRS